MVIRAVADPVEDFDIIPEYWSGREQRWIADEDLGSQMMWNPNIMPALQQDVERAIAESEFS